MIKTIEFKDISVDKLTPMAEAANFPTDDDDRSSVDKSVLDEGQIQPLIVRESKNGHYEIIDGIGRWEAAKKTGKLFVECKVVACDDPRMIVLSSNCAGRKRSVGSRVLAYMEMHKSEVLKAAKAAQIQQSSGGGVGCHSHPLVSRLPGLPILDSEFVMSKRDIPSSLKPFTQKGIAETLRVDRKTVSDALNLLICKEVGCDNKGADLEEGADDLMSETYDRVLKGETPVNRWPAAFQGKKATAGVGKAETNYTLLAERTAIALRGVFEHWSEIEWETHGQREKVESGLAAALAIMPECCKQALMELIPQSWGPHEKQTLAKSISKK